MRALGRILLAVALNLGGTGATLALGDGVEDGGDVCAAAPPGGFFCGLLVTFRGLGNR
jgi:hypothetical protein